MNTPRILQSAVLASLSALVICTGARAATFTVPGTSDPWLAGQPDGTTASLNDSAPAQSPVFAGSYLPGTILCWTADGLVLNMPGPGGFGPDGDPGWITSHSGGAENGIAALSAPLNSLVGIWYGASGGTPFFMGDEGTATVPVGATELYLGTMDGYEWNNNSGSFRVDLRVCGLPDGGSSLVLLGAAVGLLPAVRLGLRGKLCRRVSS